MLDFSLSYEVAVLLTYMALLFESVISIYSVKVILELLESMIRTTLSSGLAPMGSFISFTDANVIVDTLPVRTPPSFSSFVAVSPTY